MLRPIKSSFLHPKMSCIYVNAATDGTYSSYGSGDILVTYVSTGVWDLTYKIPFASAPVVVATAAVNGRVANVSNSTISGCRVSIFYNNTANSTHSFSVVVAGTLAASFEKRDPQPVKIGWQSNKVISGKVAAAGTISLGGTMVEVTQPYGAGIYVLTLKNAYGGLPVIVASACTDQRIVTSRPTAANTVVVETTNASRTYTNSDFNFMIVGCSNSTMPGVYNNRTLMNTVRNSFFSCFSSTKSGSSYSDTVNDVAFDVASGGTGVNNVSFTGLSKPNGFAQIPVVIAANTGARGAGFLTNVTTSGFDYTTYSNTAGSGADGRFDAIVLGTCSADVW